MGRPPRFPFRLARSLALLVSAPTVRVLRLRALRRPLLRGWPRVGGRGAELEEAVRRRVARRRTGEGCWGPGSGFVWAVGGARTAREKWEMAAPSAGFQYPLQPKEQMAVDRGRR